MTAGVWLAHAKVNLSLEVGARRADGYHPYVSHAVSVGVADTVRAAIVDRAAGVVVSTSSGIEDSLARRGAEAVLAAAGREEVALDLSIDKTIPAGAGLGGGSADAAAAMVAAAALVGREDMALTELAAGVGTDVPFCLVGGHARLHGRGELVEPLAPLPRIGVIVAVPPVQVSTTEVFAAFDTVGAGDLGDPVEQWLADLVPGCSFRNDLEAAALSVAPELGLWKARIEAVVGSAVRMTGSGAGFVCLGPEPAAFEPVAARLRESGVQAWATLPCAQGVERVG